MIYSCYDYRTKGYRYFEAPAVMPAAGGFRAPGSDRSFPECLAVKLPKGAVPAGDGPDAKGLIAVDDSRAIGAYELPGSGSFLAYAIPLLVLGYCAGRYFK